MATVAVRLAAAPAAPLGARKAILKSGRLVLPIRILSPKVTHSFLEPDWQSIPRLGDQPLMRKGNPRMQTMRADATFTVDQGDVENQLLTLVNIANSPTPVTIGNWGSFEQGFWWITAMPITSEQREEGLNRISRATVALTFTMAPYNSYKVASVTAAKPVKPTTTTSSNHPAAPAKPRTYTVKKGDTLTSIAVRIYHDADKYAVIAKANKIKNPNLIYPGQKLILP